MSTWIFCALMSVFSVIMILENAKRGGNGQVREGLSAGLQFFLTFTVSVIFLSLLAGQIQVYYLSAHHEVKSWFAGHIGIIRAYFMGLLLPGSISAGSALQNGWRDGTMNKGAIIVFLISSSMGNWLRVLFQIPVLGPKLTLATWAFGIVVSAIIATAFLIFS